MRIRAYQRALRSPSVADIDESTRRLLVGLHYGLGLDKLDVESLEGALALLHAHPAVLEELDELLPLLEGFAEHVTYPLDEELKWKHRIPLSVHARHTLDDALTAFGLLDIGRKLFKQRGVFRHEDTNSELFFVTLEKSERDYSPSTLYKDYAISPWLFHWESQSGDHAGVSNRATVHPPPRARRSYPAVCQNSARARWPDDALYTSGACRPRIAQRRSPNQFCFEAEAGNACRILPRG